MAKKLKTFFINDEDQNAVVAHKFLADLQLASRACIFGCKLLYAAMTRADILSMFPDQHEQVWLVVVSDYLKRIKDLSDETYH
ncbi:MAG: hypothetical protein KatS3mg087_1782 [Patescibacteria group bacterium]|nr:MAG: hypothetical protein KatS3mg087_1782 [Patescibacteria group bacterium]